MDDSLFDGLFEEFYLEAREQLDRIESGLLDLDALPVADRAARLVEVKRDLHTLKGNSGMMGLGDLQQGAHSLEDEVVALAQGEGQGDVDAILGGVDQLRNILEGLRQSGDSAAGVAEPAASSEEGGVRVGFAALDTLFDRVSEMVIFRNRLDDAIRRGVRSSEGAKNDSWDEVEEAHRALSSTLDFLQTGITKLRLVPLGNLFASWRRIVHDEAQRLGKEVEFRGIGGDTPIDKALLETASEAVGHLVRNAVVHGIEVPKQRRKTGKPALGQVVVAAESQGDEIHIDVEDDGGGIDLAALERRAGKLGLSLPAELDRWSLVFLPELSTASATDQSAGRGMGTAAAANAVRRRGGEIDVRSEASVGTRFRLRLPLTASIVRALLVEVDDEEYAVPMMLVHETLTLGEKKLDSMVGAGFLAWRGEHIPILDLGMAFGTSPHPRRHGRIVVVESGGRRRGILVDRIAALQDVVVKGLDDLLASPAGIAGCTILGDGRVVMIVDPSALDGGRLVEARTA